MPTILDLARENQIVKVDADLDPDEMESRRFYLLAQVEAKLEGILNAMTSEWEIETSPAEQFYELVYNFVSGESLEYPFDLRELRARDDGIWELKTADLRLFGFFPMKDWFICTLVINANVLKQNKLYQACISQSAKRRDGLAFDEPKYVQGTNPHEVVSDCYS